MRDGISIRKARMEDIERIVDLALSFEKYLIAIDDTLQQEPFPRERYRRVLLEGLNDGKHAIFVAEEDEIIAFADYWTYPEFIHGGWVGYLNNLFVDEGSRGKGIGTEMIRVILEDARSKGLVAMHVGVKPRNEDAVRFYRKLGVDEELMMMEWRLDVLPPKR